MGLHCAIQRCLTLASTDSLLSAVHDRQELRASVASVCNDYMSKACRIVKKADMVYPRLCQQLTLLYLSSHLATSSGDTRLLDKSM
jgi:hypothetical protein